MLSTGYNRQKGVQGGVKRAYFLECGSGNAEEGFRGSGFKGSAFRGSAFRGSAFRGSAFRVLGSKVKKLGSSPI
jgi:hypothetical protein